MKNIKKIFAVGALALTIGAGSIMAYADSPIEIPNNGNQNSVGEFRNENWTIEEREEWRKERFDMKREELKKAVENEEITQEEAREWEEHFNYMEEFQREHKDNSIFSGKRHGRQMNGQGSGFCGNGMGRGMMRGNRVINK